MNAIERLQRRKVIASAGEKRVRELAEACRRDGAQPPDDLLTRAMIDVLVDRIIELESAVAKLKRRGR